MIYMTGATGFIGSRVARRLLERGESVRCLVRSRTRGAALQQLGAELIDGDVADRATHVRGLQGADAAIHLAAIYDIGIVDPNEMQRTNVQGTRAFLSAAEESATARVLHVSTTAALGPVEREAIEPTDAYNGPFHSVYHRTKVEAHRLARAAQHGGAPVIIVCPSFVYGPDDEGPAGRFIVDLVRQKVPALLAAPAWFSYVYVDDVVDGIVAALERGRLGETYVLSGTPATMNDFAQKAAAVANVGVPRLRLPLGIARAMALLFDPVSKLTGVKFPITREAVQTTTRDRWLHTHRRATRDLQYHPRDLAAGLPPTIAWARHKQP